METLRHCPYAARLRERISQGAFWRNRPRYQPTFQEAWRAFNNTVNGTINSSQL